MAYVNNGDYRCKILTVNKKLDGVSLPGYPKNYDITSAFGVFASITDNQFSELSEVDFQSRLEAFYIYVDTTEGDLDSANYSYVEGEGPTGADAELCPVGE